MPNLPGSRAVLSIARFDKALSNRQGCDLKALSFIDAYGLVGTACSLRAGNATTLALPDKAAMRQHLSAMGFKDFLHPTGMGAGLPSAAPGDHPDVVVPLRAATSANGAQALSNLLYEQLADHALIMGQVYKAPRGKPPDHDLNIW